MLGNNPTIRTLEWLILYMCSHPELQEKVHEEIKSKFGIYNQVPLKERESLPFVDAVIHEVTRIVSPATSLGNRAVATRDTTVNGVHIKKGNHCGMLTSLDNSFNSGWEVMFLTTAIWKDEKIYKNPHVFNPYRFIGKN